MASCQETTSDYIDAKFMRMRSNFGEKYERKKMVSS